MRGMIMRLSITILLSLVINYGNPGAAQQPSAAAIRSGRTNCSSPQLLVISLDGFRYDYYDKIVMKSLQSFAARGAHATKGMTGVFATVTLASHYTLATGLYEESHGIVGNRFYDPATNTTFDKHSHEAHFFKGEPIWVTAKRQGKRTAVYNWVGGETDWGDNSPDVAPSFSNHVSLQKRVDQVIDNLEHDHLDLIMLYYFQPDRSSHQHGALSDDVVRELGIIDHEFERMFNIMDKKGLTDNVNIIILADHGVMNLTTDPLIMIQSDHPLLLNHTDRVIPGDVVTHVFPKPGGDHEEQTIAHLNYLLEKRGHFKVYAKKDIPDRWHFRHSPRIAPVIIVADPGYFIIVYKGSEDPHNKHVDKGNHGYDNHEGRMNPLFMAAGPDFKQNYSFSQSFQNTNIYPLLCHLMRIQAAHNNGSFAQVSHMTRHSVIQPCSSDVLLNPPSWTSLGSELLIFVMGETFRLINTGFLIHSIVCRLRA